jgi:DNA helicase-2/ATP-dependent DNA helicase PcrA
VCARPLTGGAERKLGRCADCPATYDEGLFERLRDWRLGRAREASLPAYVVFTDATLTAIAERRPGSARELAAVPGVGAAKLERYAADVLALVRGEEPDAGIERGEVRGERSDAGSERRDAAPVEPTR